MYRSASLAPLWGEPEEADLGTGLAIRRVDTRDSLAGLSASTGRPTGRSSSDGAGAGVDQCTNEDGDESWAFWQPFAGGTAFVVTQVREGTVHSSLSKRRSESQTSLGCVPKLVANSGSISQTASTAQKAAVAAWLFVSSDFPAVSNH